MIRPVLAATLALALPAHAVTLTFEGTTTGANRILDADGANAFGPSLIDYAGYDWTGMVVARPAVSIGRPQRVTSILVDPEDGPTPVTESVDAGFHRSVVGATGDTVAFTQSFAGSTSLFASMRARPGAVNFDVQSAWLTSGWRDDLSVTVVGLRDGIVVASRSLTIGDDARTFVSLGFGDIDELRFQTSGGTFAYPDGQGQGAPGYQVGEFVNPSNAFSTPALVIDDLVVTPVPEPSEIAFMLAGLTLAGTIARRRRHARPATPVAAAA